MRFQPWEKVNRDTLTLQAHSDQQQINFWRTEARYLAQHLQMFKGTDEATDVVIDRWLCIECGNPLGDPRNDVCDPCGQRLADQADQAMIERLRDSRK